MSYTRPDTKAKVVEVRARIIAETERTPTLQQIGDEIGITRERVRQILVELGFESTRAERRREVVVREQQRRAEQEAARAEKVEYKAAERRVVEDGYARGLTQVEIAAELGSSQAQVSAVALEAGLTPRRRLFSAEEDEAILSRAQRGELVALADELGRNPACVLQRWKRLVQRAGAAA